MTASSALENLAHLIHHKKLKTLEVVHLSRHMDEKMAILVKQNKGGTFHMNGLGHELVGALGALSLQAGRDFAYPYYRDKAFAIGYGSDLIELFGTFMGRATEHHSKGRMMPEHFSHVDLKIPVQSSVVGTQFLQACGTALSLKLQGKNDGVYVSCGDGATSQGDFHEALNFAALHQLGVIFVVQDNGWAISVPISEQTAGGSIIKMASGYEGLAVFDCDGTSYNDLQRAFSNAVERVRAFHGPSLIRAVVSRLGPHSSSDDPAKYQDKDKPLQDKDPIVFFETFLTQEGVVSKQDIDQIRAETKLKIDRSAKQAETLSFPEPQSARTLVFKEHQQVRNLTPDQRGESIVMVDAINHALIEQMQKDPTIIVYGQDVAKGKGGVFGATRHLTELFGPERCFNSTLAESTIIGTAIGMCFSNVHKPLIEIQFADYLWTGINQLFNECASVYYRSGGEWNCPMVIRMPAGGYIQGGPYHSQSIEGFLAHCPGIKIVMPSNAKDAKLLLKAAINDPNPVIFLEHKGLYRQRFFSCREEPLEDEMEALGVAEIIKQGSDLTLITWGMATVMSFEIVEKLASEKNLSIELIDLRTLIPYDKDCLRGSIKKTNKVLIAHEAPKQCGLGAEIAAWISEELFIHLDGPVKRVGSFESAVPYSKVLEENVLLQKKEIEEAILDLIAF